MASQDQVVIDLRGARYILPKKAGMALFEALSGSDIYIIENRWETVNGKSMGVDYIKVPTDYELPTLRVISPTQFHIGLENQRAKDEADNA
jgi:hypothetical protein